MWIFGIALRRDAQGILNYFYVARNDKDGEVIWSGLKVPADDIVIEITAS